MRDASGIPSVSNLITPAAEAACPLRAAVFVGLDDSLPLREVEDLHAYLDRIGRGPDCTLYDVVCWLIEYSTFDWDISSRDDMLRCAKLAEELAVPESGHLLEEEARIIGAALCQSARLPAADGAYAVGKAVGRLRWLGHNAPDLDTLMAESHDRNKG